MSYVQRVLQPGEILIYATRLHWLVYARAVGLLIVAAVLAGIAERADNELRMALWAGGGGLFVLAVIAGIGAGLRRASTEFAVTNRRIIHKSGIIRRHTQEMNLSKVETVIVDQTILGRILNFGSVRVHGTGGYTEFTLHPYVADPMHFRSAIKAE